MAGLNSELLRTFLAVAESGSVTDGAERVSRSQSAASLQIKRLEDIIGQPVFARHGRGVSLTEPGERLLGIARDVTHRLDAAKREFAKDRLSGVLRLGIPDDQSRERISQIIAAFTQSHPSVELHVTCGQGSQFPAAIESGSLDLAIYELETARNDVEVLWEEPTFWMTSRFHDVLARDPLPVALFDRDCWWRDAALAALQKTGREFRIVYSSQSVAGVAAAIEAGIAVGLLGETSQTNGLEIVGSELGFGEMPVSRLVLASNPSADTNLACAMKEAIRRAYSKQSAHIL